MNIFNKIINNLPNTLKETALGFVDETEREVFLISALGVISGILPNVTSKYAGKKIGTNLYIYILGGYGSGKGTLDMTRIIAEEIHNEKLQSTATESEKYQLDIEAYNKQLKLYNKNKDGESRPPVKPKAPPQLMLFIPANNSKSGLYELLKDNKGNGIIFETEGDTLVTALNQDFGGFSDILRKAFHHEDFNMYRRGNREHIEIKNPHLSLILSSTHDQLRKLIVTPENGLFSRFLYYELSPCLTFSNVFDERKNEYVDMLSHLGGKLKDLHYTLSCFDMQVVFSLTNKQKQFFTKHFDHKKKKIIEEFGNDLNGTVNRLGIIAYRIMMILTVLRCYENNCLGEKVECSNTDFYNVLRLVRLIEQNSIKLYLHLSGKKNDQELSMDLARSGKGPSEISKILFGNADHRGTVHKWINK